MSDAKTDEPVASNYYPINAWISTTNTNDGKSVTILTDRSSGASSITDDSIEVFFSEKKPKSNHLMYLFFQVMIHRRLLDDDAFGVDQPLNETEFGGKGLVARGTHYLLFDPNVEDQLVRTRLLAKSIFASPIVTLNRFFQYPIFFVNISILQSLTIAIVFELIYYTNGHPRA